MTDPVILTVLDQGEGIFYDRIVENWVSRTRYKTSFSIFHSSGLILSHFTYQTIQPLCHSKSFQITLSALQFKLTSHSSRHIFPKTPKYRRTEPCRTELRDFQLTIGFYLLHIDLFLLEERSNDLFQISSSNTKSRSLLLPHVENRRCHSTNTQAQHWHRRV